LKQTHITWRDADEGLNLFDLVQPSRCKQQKKFRLKLQNDCDWTLSSQHEAKYYKQPCVCMAVYELLTALLALELALPEEEIPEHMHSTQYQFKVLKM